MFGVRRTPTQEPVSHRVWAVKESMMRIVESTQNGISLQTSLIAHHRPVIGPACGSKIYTLRQESRLRARQSAPITTLILARTVHNGAMLKSVIVLVSCWNLILAATHSSAIAPIFLV